MGGCRLFDSEITAKLPAGSAAGWRGYGGGLADNVRTRSCNLEVTTLTSLGRACTMSIWKGRVIIQWIWSMKKPPKPTREMRQIMWAIRYLKRKLAELRMVQRVKKYL